MKDLGPISTFLGVQNQLLSQTYPSVKTMSSKNHFTGCGDASIV